MHEKAQLYSQLVPNASICEHGQKPKPWSEQPKIALFIHGRHPPIDLEVCVMLLSDFHCYYLGIDKLLDAVFEGMVVL